MHRLLLATGNPGKQRELRELLAGCGWELVLPQELGLALDTAETGQTYAENAKIKALAAARLSRLPALADDSGIEVDALNGAPGVLSARYAGEGATDASRRQRLLEAMTGVPEGRRGAAFRAVIAIAMPAGEVLFAEGECAGAIATEERGEGGFGYDPIFLVPELGKTMAELPQHTKNEISHRAKAARAASSLLRELASRG